jgi:broad specificity phosphatase PhoE
VSPAAPNGHRVWLVRHGETEWARDGRHTGRTDIPLTETGRLQARDLAPRLAGHDFVLVLTSPRSRASETARLAGFDKVAVDDDLQEWDYGDLEGLTTQEIRARIPGWSIWTGPWPGGESAREVGARADRVIARCVTAASDGDVLLFSHGHFLRVMAARWIELPPASGGRFALDTATVSVLAWEHDTRVIETWNED